MKIGIYYYIHLSYTNISKNICQDINIETFEQISIYTWNTDMFSKYDHLVVALVHFDRGFVRELY